MLSGESIGQLHITLATQEAEEIENVVCENSVSRDGSIRKNQIRLVMVI